jgi:hypothetical protein
VNITHVREGDIVQVDGEAVCFVAEVVREPGRFRRLRLASTSGKWSPPVVTGSRVTGIWHATKQTGKTREALFA